MKIINMLTNVNRTIANRTAKDIKHIVIHYVGAVSSARNNGKYFKDVYRGASANDFVDEFEIVHVVDYKDIAWAVGTNGKVYNDCYNSNSISIELCCKRTSNGAWYFEEQTLRNAVELVRYLLTLFPNAKLCRHWDVTHKVCPEPMVRNKQLWDSFVAECLKKENNKKSNEEIARDVINGKYGNGQDRKNNLENAGYNYGEIQKIVNDILLGNNKKSNEEIAIEVIAGKFGNGAERKAKLEAQGYNYGEIQKIVNAKLG